MAEQYLQQSQSQQQTQVLAPQLRQGLEMLQASILELRALVEQELQSNPTLEELPNEEQEQIEIEPSKSEDDRSDEPDAELNFDEEFDALSRLDDDWKEFFRENQTVGSSFAEENEKRQFLIDSLTRETTLHEHLTEQLNYADLSPLDRQMAELLVGCVDSDGYLNTSLEELAESTGLPLPPLEDLLTLIQGYDPPGVAARDLKECLLLQLMRDGRGESAEARLVRDHLDLLGSRKYQEISRQMKIPMEEVDRLSKLVARLNPKPGRAFASTSQSYVLPEVFIEQVDGEWVITTNDGYLPHLRISKHYRNLMEDPGTSSEVRTYIRDKVRAGAFLIRSIGQRQQTITNITREIVKVQEPFLMHGVSHLKPLTMSEVADKLGIHETTVSRAIAHKYVSTPQGVYEMKYFFTPGFKNAEGESVSNKSIKDAIEQLIAGENARKPYSDQALVGILKERGLEVARRTVAKYREELNILPSHLRKGI